MEWLVFADWLISQTNGQKDCSNYLGKAVKISRNWATVHFLIFDCQPWNYPEAGGVSFIILLYYNEGIMWSTGRQIFHHLRSSWLQPVLVRSLVVLCPLPSHFRIRQGEF